MDWRWEYDWLSENEWVVRKMAFCPFNKQAPAIALAMWEDYLRLRYRVMHGTTGVKWEDVKQAYREAIGEAPIH